MCRFLWDVLPFLLRIQRGYTGKNKFAEGSKILLDLKTILLNHQNNFVRTLNIMNNAAKNFDILATSLSVLIILIVQQNYFSDLYPTKILDLSAKPFFPCTYYSKALLSCYSNSRINQDTPSIPRHRLQVRAFADPLKNRGDT